MKCIHCGKDSKLKERTNGRCKHCQRPFAFEPTKQQGVSITDPGFQAAIVAATGQGRLAITARQLYYQTLRPQAGRERRRKEQQGSGGLIFGIVVGGFVFFACGVVGRVFPLRLAGLIAGVVILFTIVGWVMSRRSSRRAAGLSMAPQIDFARFQQDFLYRWQQVHGPIAKLLPPPTTANDGGGRSAHAEELQHYSFDRLLVCDRAETAAFLLANNLHTETNTPIISADGYPQAAYAQVLAMVRRNPNLQVFVLHDADTAGCLLPLQLREDPRWFPQPSMAIIDIGLRPRQVAARGGAIVLVPQGAATALPPGLERALTPGERAWLATGHRGELAAVPPARLLQTVYRAFTQSAQEVERQRAAAQRDPRGFFRTAM